MQQPLRTECFESTFLEYLRMRFEFEPLPHYTMAAMQICHETDREYPDFVRGFLAWFSQSFLFDDQGLPITSNNANPADAQWRKYADCHDLLTGWLDDDLDAALKSQEARFELIELVEIVRGEERAAVTPHGRNRSTRKPDTEVFAEVADDLNLSRDMVQRTFRAMMEPVDLMSPILPVALLKTDGMFHIETRQVGCNGEIRFKAGKTLRP